MNVTIALATSEAQHHNIMAARPSAILRTNELRKSLHAKEILLTLVNFRESNIMRDETIYDISDVSFSFVAYDTIDKDGCPRFGLGVAVDRSAIPTGTEVRISLKFHTDDEKQLGFNTYITHTLTEGPYPSALSSTKK